MSEGTNDPCTVLCVLMTDVRVRSICNRYKGLCAVYGWYGGYHTICTRKVGIRTVCVQMISPLIARYTDDQHTDCMYTDDQCTDCMYACYMGSRRTVCVRIVRRQMISIRRTPYGGRSSSIYAITHPNIFSKKLPKVLPHTGNMYF